MVEQDSPIEHILTFWFIEAGPKKWFNGGPDFDAEIKERFKAVACQLADELARSGRCAWEESPRGALAAIIALDQFSRNIFRDSPESFAWDAMCLALARRVLARGDDVTLSPVERSFVYMPFMHSEDIDDQNLCVELMTDRVTLENNIHHAHEHRKLIERFGRFPHRNGILGRANTLQEEEFLRDGGYTP